MEPVLAESLVLRRSASVDVDDLSFFIFIFLSWRSVLLFFFPIEVESVWADTIPKQSMAVIERNTFFIVSRIFVYLNLQQDSAGEQGDDHRPQFFNPILANQVKSKDNSYRKRSVRVGNENNPTH